MYTARSISEVMADMEARNLKLRQNPVWGDWTYDYKTEHLCFKIDGDSDEYHIQMNNIKQSSQILDWVFQLHSKPWITDKDMRDLLEAFRWLLSPQAHYCSFGSNRNTDSKTLLPTKP